MIKQRINTLTVADDGGVTIDLDDVGVSTYICSDTPTVTFTSGWTLDTTGSAEDGMSVLIFWKATPNFNSQTVTILGATIPVAQSGKTFMVWAIYKDSAWQVNVFPDLHQAAGVPGIGGGNIDLDGVIDNDDIDASAAIAYSKLNLAASILNSDIDASAAIAYSKLDLADSIDNADINSSAAIAYSKLALTGQILNADINAAAAIAYSKLDVADSITNADINSAAAIALTKLAAVTASRALVSDGSGNISASAVTATEMGYLSGVSSSIQTQISGLVSATLAQGSILVGSGASEAAPLDAKDSGKVLIGNGTTVASQSISNDATLAADGQLTIGANKVTPSKADASMRTDPLIIPVSFETGFTGTALPYELPSKVNVTKISVVVIKAIAGTDDATINFKDDSGNNFSGSALTSGSLTITQSSALGTVFSTTVTANNEFAANEDIQITPSKSTAGGEVHVILHFEKQD